MTSCRALATLAILASSCTALAAEGSAPMIAEKWLFLFLRLGSDARVNDTIDLLERAAGDGYGTVFLFENALLRLDFPKLTENRGRIEKAVRACRDLQLKVVLPACAGFLANDPNLAEGMPVVDAPFTVQGGRLLPADQDLRVANPSFEQVGTGDVPKGWFMEFGPKCCSVDRSAKAEGQVSIRMRDIKANATDACCVISQTIKVKPYRYYHMTVKVKTEGFENPPAIMIGPTVGPPGDRYGLNHQMFKIDKTQDWKLVDAIFDTMDRNEIDLHLGAWGAGNGTIWFDDLRIEPGGLVNLIRREGAPFKMTSKDGKTVYEEGRDFSKAIDPKMGHVGPIGNYAYWYEQPVVTTPAGSRIRDDQEVLLSYSHAVLIYEWGVMHCMNRPQVWDIAKAQVRNLHQLLQPDGYFLCHDEIRFQGWDESCRKAAVPMHKLLAEDVRRATETIRQEDPAKPIYIWSDMFDPFHNAGKTKHYYLVKGENPWYGSWEGLDKSVVIMNWHGHNPNRLDSLKFFADRGHKQILAGYYDAPVENIVPWLEDAAKVPGVYGVMYTTWADDYKQIAPFAKAIDGFRPKP